jgi:hypothetical protein
MLPQAVPFASIKAIRGCHYLCLGGRAAKSLGEGKSEITGGWCVFFGGAITTEGVNEGSYESFSSDNVLTSLKYVIAEHENFDVLNGYKFT